MQKWNRNFLMYVGIIAVALFLLFVLSGNLKPLSLSVLSISNVEIKDNGAKILVTVIPQGTDNLEVDFTPSALNSFLESKGYEATNTAILKMKYIESSKKFYFSTSAYDTNTVKALSSVDTGNDILIRCGINMCQNRGYANSIAWYLTDTSFGNIPNCNCVTYTNNGYVNSFNTGLGTDGFKVYVDVNGEVGYVTGDEQSISEK